MVAVTAQAIFCELGGTQRSSTDAAPTVRKEMLAVAPIPRIRAAEAPPAAEGGKRIVLQPRLCTLRSYGSGGLAPASSSSSSREREAAMSSFFASLADYVESARKSHDFEIVSGRLAMVAFAAAVCVEGVTGDSLFKKQDSQQIAEAAGVCVAVVACAAAFAWVSSARTRIGQMFTLSCNSFVDALIDNIIEALFYDGEIKD